MRINRNNNSLDFYGRRVMKASKPAQIKDKPKGQEYVYCSCGAMKIKGTPCPYCGAVDECVP